MSPQTDPEIVCPRCGGGILEIAKRWTQQRISGTVALSSKGEPVETGIEYDAYEWMDVSEAEVQRYECGDCYSTWPTLAALRAALLKRLRHRVTIDTANDVVLVQVDGFDVFLELLLDGSIEVRYDPADVAGAAAKLLHVLSERLHR